VRLVVFKFSKKEGRQGVLREFVVLSTCNPPCVLFKLRPQSGMVFLGEKLPRIEFCYAPDEDFPLKQLLGGNPAIEIYIDAMQTEDITITAIISAKSEQAHAFDPPLPGMSEWKGRWGRNFNVGIATGFNAFSRDSFKNFLDDLTSAKENIEVVIHIGEMSSHPLCQKVARGIYRAGPDLLSS
jgi:hypothetical protein